MAATQLAAGNIPSALPTSEEVQEYEKILRISDDIFSGAHPRLKVPQQFVRKPASRHLPTSVPVKPNGTLESPPTHPAPSVSTPTKPVNAPASHGATVASNIGRIAAKPASEIDPIFLTKSDDLVRAELQLHRQRVERALRDQLEQRRQESKHKALVQDTKPDFDVSEVLNKALELVNPSPSMDGPGAGDPSDSFDDNSFYSSRAPDSPQHGEPQPPSPVPPVHAEKVPPAGLAGNYSDELQRLEALNRTESDQELQSTYPVAGHRIPYPQRRSRLAEPDLEVNDYYEPAPPAETFDEPEYSPPAPGVAPMERADGQDSYRGHPSGPRRRIVDSRLTDRPRYARRSISAGDDVRIVRNHITSPAAPQPSRVSPLTMAKVPSVHQHRESRPAYEPERHGSPATVPQQLMPRKRRRVHDDRDRTRPASYRLPDTGPEEPYIKPEPVSPPPFADDPPPYRTRPPQERPVYIDIASPRYTPVLERREPSVREPVYELDPYEYPNEIPVTRTVSRLSIRRPLRDDQDLRRVASFQQARQSEYPREYIEQSSPHSVRASSYAYVERPPHERTRYYEDIAQPPPPTRRYVPAGESPNSPRYREAYYEEEIPSRIMAPPPRRIVVDEHNNQYYEQVPAPRMQMMPPPPAGRRTEVYDDHASIRHASVRAASVLEDPYGTRRLVQEVPPQGAYRRVADYARPVPTERRPYATPLEEPYPRSSSVQVASYPAPSRHPTYMEETELPRERIVRVPSVRPPTTTARYEGPEMIQRVESVRPGGREVSVYVDDDGRRAREYVERPVYVQAARPLPREERYYENGEPERMVLDDGVRRVSQRY